MVLTSRPSRGSNWKWLSRETITEGTRAHVCITCDLPLCAIDCAMLSDRIIARQSRIAQPPMRFFFIYIKGATLQWIFIPSTTPFREDKIKPSQEQVNSPSPSPNICSALLAGGGVATPPPPPPPPKKKKIFKTHQNPKI